METSNTEVPEGIARILRGAPVRINLRRVAGEKKELKKVINETFNWSERKKVRKFLNHFSELGRLHILVVFMMAKSEDKFDLALLLLNATYEEYWSEIPEEVRGEFATSNDVDALVNTIRLIGLGET